MRKTKDGSLRRLLGLVCLILVAAVPEALLAQSPATVQPPVAPQSPTTVQPPTTEENLVRDATVVLDEIMSIPAKGIPTNLFKSAEGIAIFPSLMKGGFIVGVQAGDGVLLIKKEDGRWEYPRFTRLAGGSVGFQAGVQSTDIILFFCTPRSIESILKGKFTIGADASVAAGPVGRHTSAATDVKLSSEIYSWSRSRGVFLGAALDGLAMEIEGARTTEFYQKGTPEVANVLVQKILQYANAE